MIKSEKSSLIIEFASLLAERDLVERYDLLAHQLRNEDGQYLDKYQGEASEFYDTYCDKLTKLSQSLIENEMDKQWNEYVEKNGAEPKVAEVTIQYIDSPCETQGVTIKMSGDNDDEDNIFFYCESLKDLKSLTGEGGVDFTVTSINSFGT